MLKKQYSGEEENTLNYLWELIYILQQIICAIKIRRAPARHDNVDFQPIIERASKIMPMSVVVVADKGYDSEEDNHVLVRENYHALSIIPTRYKDVPIWRTSGKYRKQMKHGFSNILYTIIEIRTKL